MENLQFEIVDVFTSSRFSGNGLAVIKNGEALSDQQMQAIAREFNLSETVFILSPENKAHSANIRIFTPAEELPFAGHPTVGAAVVVALTQLGQGDDIPSHEDAIVILEEGIGTIRAGVSFRTGKAPFAEFDLPRLPVEIDNLPTNDELSMVLGLSSTEIGFENHQPSCFEAGMPFVFVPVRDLEVIGEAVANAAAMEKLLGNKRREVFLYCRETVKNDSSFHARMFAPLLGINEDPATGAAVAAFGGVVMKYDQPARGTKNYIIEQGIEMGRPSEIHLELIINDALKNVRIGGHVVKVASGTLEV
ncbi:MAG: PhzF family phenazine biosynthesis protein [Hyphomicrobiaceae bacterium]|nr:PhzF family phenazine biosynthesis protein [Hyphomicrobiaceae bacterium]